MHHRRTAFTLIELLVVIAIISILMSPPLPSLNRAKEQARRTVCMANMKNIGIAAMSFADDNEGYLPRGNMPAPTLGWMRNAWLTSMTMDYETSTRMDHAGQPFPPRGEFEENPDYGEPQWRHTGTSRTTWETYGVDPDNLDCPSAEGGVGNRNDTSEDLRMQYVMPVGLDEDTTGHGQAHKLPGGVGRAISANWNGDTIAYPANRIRDKDLSKRILIADKVGYGWNWAADTNHSVDGVNPMWQGIGYGDGHVGILKDSDYDTLTSTNFSFKMHSSGNAPRYWWGMP